MRFSFVAIAAAALLMLTGCAPKRESAVTPDPTTKGGNPLAQDSPATPSPTPPGVTDSASAVTEHGGRETPEGTPGTVVIPPGFSPGAGGTLTATPVLDARIAGMEKKPEGKKPELAAAYAERGYARMTDAAAAPRVKYPAALKDFRRALELDPKNADARKNADMIETIYQRMGRPVPTD